MIRPLLPARYRRTAGAVMVLCIGLVAALGVHFAGRAQAGRLDGAISGVLGVPRGPLRLAAHGFVDLGDPAPVAGALAVLVVLGWGLRGPRGALLGLLGPLLAMVSTSLVLKPLVGRTHAGGLALPSGHTTAVVSLAAAAALLLAGTLTLPRAGRLAGVAALGTLSVLVAVSLVVAGQHYGTDTFAGVGVAVAAVLLVALIIDHVAERWALSSALPLPVATKARRPTRSSSCDRAPGPRPGPIAERRVRHAGCVDASR